MIRLITGNPGNAKTLFALYDLLAQLEENEKEGLKRNVYYFNIEFDLEHTLNEKVKDWVKVDSEDLTTNLPLLYGDEHPVIKHGSIILVDECQDLYPTRNKGDVPEFLKFFEKHRHTGCDFWLITQKPRQIDIHLRELTGEHYHFQRVLGREASRVKYLNRLIDSKSENSLEIQTQVRKFPKELYGLYKSAVLHTHKRKLPWKLKVGLPLLFLFLAAMVFVVYHTLFEKNKNKTETSSTINSSALPTSIPTHSQEDFKIYLSSVISVNSSVMPVFIYVSDIGAKIILYKKDLAKLGHFEEIRPGLYTFNSVVIPYLPEGGKKNEKNTIFNN